MSFSCDACQNVFTKPKVLRHFHNCRTHSVSCIDCCVVFNAQSVRGHSSCVTEAEKYGPKGETTACTQTFCGICKLSLNGAVHALQHYESKKHRSTERKLKVTEKAGSKIEKVDASRTDVKLNTQQQETVAVPAVAAGQNENVEKGKKSKGVKKAMKSILKKQPKLRLKRDRLVRAVSKILGKDSPSDLGAIVDKKALKSESFKIRNGRVSLSVQGT